MAKSPLGVLGGIGVGAAALGVGALAGVAARAIALAPETGEDYAWTASSEQIVVADDGVVLHVEIDEPAADQSASPLGPTAEQADWAGPVPTIVLSHGYTLSMKAWIFVRRALTAAGYRVVTHDHRGHGLSGVGTRDSYRIEQLARDLRLIIDTVVPEGPIVLVGHSMGGMSLMSLARQFPQLVRDRVVAVAFVATSVGGEGELRVELGDAFGRSVQRLGPFALAPLTGRQTLVETARKVARDAEDFFTYHYSFASPVPLSLVRYAAGIIMGTPIEVIHGFLKSLSSHDEHAGLAQFDGIETLVINGTGDLMTPPKHSLELVRSLPGAEHVVVEDAGHLIMLEYPELVSSQLLAMLARAARHGREQTASPHGVRTEHARADRRKSTAAIAVERLPRAGQPLRRHSSAGAPKRPSDATPSQRAVRRGKGGPPTSQGSRRGRSGRTGTDGTS